MICRKCNKEISDDSVFCSGCGCEFSQEEENNAENQEKTKKPMNKKHIITLLAAVVVIVTGAGLYINSTPEAKYKKAEAAFASGNYVDAINYYTAAGEYEDSLDKLAIAERANHHATAIGMMEIGNYEEAKTELIDADGYEDADSLMQQCDYNIALAYMEIGDYETAAEFFKESADYKDADGKVIEMGQYLISIEQYDKAVTIFSYAKNGLDEPYAQYANGMASLNSKDYSKAASYFYKAGDVFDAEEQYKDAQYNYANLQLSSLKYSIAKAAFEKISGYKDSSDLMNACNMMLAKENMDNGNLNIAKSSLEKLPPECAYNGISVATLLEKLNKNSKWLELCGTWSSTGGQMRTTQSGSYGYSNWWYRDFEAGEMSLDVKCILNDDSTVTVITSGSVPIYTKYSSISAGLKLSEQSAEIKQPMSNMGTVDINELTSISLSPSKISLSYKKVDNSHDVYFTYTYKTDVTYGQKLSSY